MEPSSRARLHRLRGYLTHGLSACGTRARQDLGLPEDADDRDVAHALVQILSAVDVASSTESDAIRDPREREETRPVPVPGGTLLARLEAGEGDGMDVDLISDVETLLAVLRAGNLRQRRAALRHLMALMRRDELTSGGTRQITEALVRIRDVSIARELAKARAELPGAVGREARAEGELWRRRAEELAPRIEAYWEGEASEDPLFELEGDVRAQLLSRARELPELQLAHLAAAIDGSGGSLDLERRRALLGALRYAGDPRLLPTLVGILREGGLRSEATRALAHIDDPRVQTALREEYRRSVVEHERVVLAGALGVAGDGRGRPEVLENLARREPEILVLTLEALESLGCPEDVAGVIPLLAHEERAVLSAAIRCLGRVADGRALATLRRRASDLPDSALRAEADEARAAIEARMILLGEQVAGLDERGAEVLLAAPSSRPRLPWHVRIGAKVEYLVGWALLHLGANARSIYHFERAARRRPQWGAPLIAIGMAFARRGDHARALPAFRLAMECDRARIEMNPVVVRTAARSFLRRAEEVRREGRRDVASGLVGEVLMLDLRRAPSALRLELERVQRALRAERAS